jgi:hypothetical protein
MKALLRLQGESAIFEPSTIILMCLIVLALVRHETILLDEIEDVAHRCGAV